MGGRLNTYCVVRGGAEGPFPHTRNGGGGVVVSSLAAAPGALPAQVPLGVGGHRERQALLLPPPPPPRSRSPPRASGPASDGLIVPAGSESPLASPRARRLSRALPVRSPRPLPLRLALFGFLSPPPSSSTGLAFPAPFLPGAFPRARALRASPARLPLNRLRNVGGSQSARRRRAPAANRRRDRRPLLSPRPSPSLVSSCLGEGRLCGAA